MSIPSHLSKRSLFRGLAPDDPRVPPELPPLVWNERRSAIARELVNVGHLHFPGLVDHALATAQLAVERRLADQVDTTAPPHVVIAHSIRWYVVSGRRLQALLDDPEPASTAGWAISRGQLETLGTQRRIRSLVVCEGEVLMVPSQLPEEDAPWAP